MEKLIIIGANEFQKRIVDKARVLGYETHVIAWEDGAVAKDAADFFYPISIIDKEKILDLALKINPSGICSIASDLAMPTVNFIASKLKLTGNSLECTMVTTNKFEMRKVLSGNNLPCPKYKLVRTVGDIDFEYFAYPIVVKPIDRSGSRGVNKVDNIDEAEDAINNARTVSFAEEVLVEEYIEGKEYSVEFISQNSLHHFLQITEKFTTNAPNFIEKGHLSPARLPSAKCKEIIRVIEKSLDSLGVENGASHSEVKINNGEIKIIEIAARMGGDFIGSDMVCISTGYDFLKNTIHVALGREIDLISQQKHKIAFVGFIFEYDDIKRFELIKENYPHIVKEYKIENNMKSVNDSSTRNGYFILETECKEIMADVLGILKLEG